MECPVNNHLVWYAIAYGHFIFPKHLHQMEMLSRETEKNILEKNIKSSGKKYAETYKKDKSKKIKVKRYRGIKV